MTAEIIWVNDGFNHPLRFELPNGDIVGQFYNSWDKKYHLAQYTPFGNSPRKYLCGGTGNFSISRCVHDRNKCVDCFNLASDIYNGVENDC